MNPNILHVYFVLYYFVLVQYNHGAPGWQVLYERAIFLADHAKVPEMLASNIT